MNNKTLTIAALAAVLVAGVFATTPMAAYAGGDYDGDSSETDTEQEHKAKERWKWRRQPTSTVQITTLAVLLKTDCYRSHR